MSKGLSGHFKGTTGSIKYERKYESLEDIRQETNENIDTTKYTYNDADSDAVKDVDVVNNLDITGHKKPPTKGIPNSVTRIIDRGKVIRERYYDESGDVYLDIDYTDHNNPKNHPVPHQHHWIKDEIGRIRRNPVEKIIRKENN